MFIFAGAEAEIFATCEFSKVAKIRILRIFAGTVPACEIFIPVHCSPSLFIILSFCEYIYIYIWSSKIVYIFIYLKKNCMFAKFCNLRNFATCEFSQPVSISQPNFV